MALVPTSTTESQEALDHAAKPPADTSEPAKESRAMDELPLKEYMAARAPQEADWKERRDNSEPRKKLGGFQRKLLKERERANAAEARATELEARLNGNHSAVPDTATSDQTSSAPVDTNAPRETAPTTQGPRQTARAYEKNFEEAARNFPDFDQVIAQADANGFQVAEDVEAAIKSSGHPAAIAYAIAKSPEIQRLLTEEPNKAVEHIQEIARRISGIHAAPQDPATARHDALLAAHRARVSEVLKGDQDLLKQSGKVQIPVVAYHAVLEQPNSHEVAVYLAKNPDVARSLVELPTQVAVIAKVGRIAEQLASRSAAQRERYEPPPPIRPISGSGSAQSTVALGEMKLSEFKKVRDRQEWAWKRGK